MFFRAHPTPSLDVADTERSDIDVMRSLRVSMFASKLSEVPMVDWATFYLIGAYVFAHLHGVKPCKPRGFTYVMTTHDIRWVSNNWPLCFNVQGSVGG